MDVVVAGALRSPMAQRSGGLKDWHAADLLGRVLADLTEHSGLDAEAVDVVIGSCSTAVGEQALNVTRNGLLAAGWPEHVPASTLEGGAVSGVYALQHAYALIASGMADVVVVSGVESASHVPAGSSTGIAVGKPFGPGVHARYAPEGGLVASSLALEKLAHRHGIVRSQMDEWARRSRQRRRAASESGVENDFVTAVPLSPSKTTDADAWLTGDEFASSLDLEDLKPLFEVDGKLTAANLAQPGDGAAAMVLMSAESAAEHRTHVLAHVREVTVVGASVLEAESGWRAAERSAFDMGGLGAVCVREDSAVTPLAFAREAGCGADELNYGGGWLAVAEPTGAAVLADLMSLLARPSSRPSMYVCAGAAQAVGTVTISHS